jgi:hypothetical protein
MLDNLILTTARHSSNEGLEENLGTIEAAVNYIGPATARCGAVWSKFLLHGGPTHVDLGTIRNQVEGYCGEIKLGQTPRWLAPPEARANKTHSTIVLAIVGEVNFTKLAGRSLLVGNRTCNLTVYKSFGPQTQCMNCQAFGHPKDFCQTGPKCAVCLFIYLFFISFNVIQPIWLCRQIQTHKIADLSERRKQANKQKKAKQHT